jgi:hypothetical protein
MYRLVNHIGVYIHARERSQAHSSHSTQTHMHIQVRTHSCAQKRTLTSTCTQAHKNKGYEHPHQAHIQHIHKHAHTHAHTYTKMYVRTHNQGICTLITQHTQMLITLAADPLAGLVETAFIGRLGAVELAGMAVGLSIFSTITKFLNIPLISRWVSPTSTLLLLPCLSLSRVTDALMGLQRCLSFYLHLPTANLVCPSFLCFTLLTSTRCPPPRTHTHTCSTTTAVARATGVKKPDTPAQSPSEETSEEQREEMKSAGEQPSSSQRSTAREGGGQQAAANPDPSSSTTTITTLDSTLASSVEGGEGKSSTSTTYSPSSSSREAAAGGNMKDASSSASGASDPNNGFVLDNTVALPPGTWCPASMLSLYVWCPTCEDHSPCIYP